MLKRKGKLLSHLASVIEIIPSLDSVVKEFSCHPSTAYSRLLFRVAGSMITDRQASLNIEAGE